MLMSATISDMECQLAEVEADLKAVTDMIGRKENQLAVSRRQYARMHQMIVTGAGVDGEFKRRKMTEKSIFTLK